MFKIRARKLLWLSFVLFEVIPAAFAQGNYALVWGGNCNWNQADQESKMVEAADTLSGRHWNVTVGYDKSGSEIASSLPASYKGKLTDGSKKTLMDFLDNAEKNAKLGDEVLIVVVAHGGVEAAGQTHAWALPDCSELPVDGTDLQSRLSQLQKNGVHIAVADGSCYGGDSVQHFQDYGCVLTDQGDTETIGMQFIDNMAKDAAKHPAAMSLETIFRDMLVNQPKLPTAYIVEPQLSGFTHSAQVSSDDATSVTAQFDVLDDQVVDFSCSAAAVLSDFNAFESGLLKLMGTDNEILSATLKKTIETDDQNLKKQLGLQDQLLSKMDTAVDAVNSIQVAPANIDLAQVSPALKNFLNDFQNPNFTSGDGSFYQVKDGQLIIPWKIWGLNSPEQTAKQFLSEAAEMDPSFALALKKEPKIAQDLQDAATAAKTKSYASLSSDKMEIVDENNKQFFSIGTNELGSVQSAIQDAEVRIDADVRALRVIEFDRLTRHPKGASPSDQKHLKNCMDFKI